MTNGLVGQLKGRPATPSMSGASGLVAGRARMRARVGVNTTRVRLYAGNTLVLTKSVQPYASVDLGYVRMPTTSTGTLKVIADNPDGYSASASRTVRRLIYPASTSIVIDKSDFRLYWVRDDVLVASYPVAIGRPDWGETPVAMWKIGAKYYTDPSGVYGPRKMRLYRKSGRSYVFTAYNIHGTNQEWVIGTKASHGCIRMYNRDVLELFPQVGLGTIVQTRE
jgi:lipoprotein-anchoring transpeptidase ErfK/SrfK